MKQLSVGLMLLAVLASGSTGCRKDKPPAIDILLHDGMGGGDGQLREGSRLRSCCIKEQKGWYCPPSCLENAWMTTQEDMEAWASWCYDTSRKNVRRSLSDIRKSVGR